MSFLLDTDTCSAHIKRPAGLMHRFVQHSGRLRISTVTLGELYTWASLRPNSEKFRQRLKAELLADVEVLLFDEACALRFGEARASLLKQGVQVSRIDLLIAAVALANNLVLVTHNTKDFRFVPGLQFVDWLED